MEEAPVAESIRIQERGPVVDRFLCVEGLKEKWGRRGPTAEEEEGRGREGEEAEVMICVGELRFVRRRRGSAAMAGDGRDKAGVIVLSEGMESEWREGEVITRSGGKEN